ncbi:MAG: Uma2 family endonuclease [Chloroflexi bacterium]|nr:Uma2 family endonuclease [Chloroflexota bacterium]
MAIREQFISADRFLDLVDAPEYQDRVLELVEGVIIEMPKPKRIHGVVVAELTFRLTAYVKENDLGEVTAGDPGFVLERNEYGRDTVRGLDIAFVSKSKDLGPPDFTWYELGPDLAVEVISPSNKADDIHFKVTQLLEAGTRLIWLVYPKRRTVVAHTAEGAKTLRQDDTLSGGDVLPGFKLRVSKIFPG